MSNLENSIMEIAIARAALSESFSLNPNAILPYLERGICLSAVERAIRRLLASNQLVQVPHSEGEPLYRLANQVDRELFG